MVIHKSNLEVSTVVACIDRFGKVSSLQFWTRIMKKGRKINEIILRNLLKWYVLQNFHTVSKHLKMHFRSKWRLLMKLFKHLSLIFDHFRTLYRSQMSGKHTQNIWRTSGDVYSTKFFFFEKIDFFSSFWWFSSIFWAFHQMSRAQARAQMLQLARDFQNHKIQDLRNLTHFLPCPYHLSRTFWRILKSHCKKTRFFAMRFPKKTWFSSIFCSFLSVFCFKIEKFHHTWSKKRFSRCVLSFHTASEPIRAS